jgi:3-hydroxyisobutyrate dehydrogenase-like beta-hydroxyacid dehydrogenase
MSTLFQVVSSGGANSTMFQLIMPWVLEGDDSHMRARLSIPSKDMRAYCRIADEASVPVPLAQAINQMLMAVTSKDTGTI